MRALSVILLAVVVICADSAAGESQSHYAEEWRAIYAAKLKNTLRKYGQPGEKVHHRDSNYTVESSNGFSGEVKQIEETVFVKTSHMEETWITTLTTFSVGKNKEGDVDEMIIVTLVQNNFEREDFLFWDMDGDGVFYIGTNGKFDEAGSVDLTGSGHENHITANESIVITELFQIYETGGYLTEILSYSDTTVEFKEEVVESSGSQTITFREVAPQTSGEGVPLPIQVNQIKTKGPLPNLEGEITEEVNGMQFTEKDDYTYSSMGEGYEWTTNPEESKLASKFSYLSRITSRALRSTLSSRIMRNTKHK